jgi:hypothetical protein
MNALAGPARMDYETPSHRISITGYVARRLHKTILLKDIDTTLPHTSHEALALFALYAAAASVSYGPARYQPSFDRSGTTIHENDPDTGASVTVTHLTRQPQYVFECEVELPNGGRIHANEAILGTTVSLHGLGMPAPSFYEFQHGAYHAQASGIIHSELSPRLFGAWQICGHGELELVDNLGNRGQTKINRRGEIHTTVKPSHGHIHHHTFKLL